MSLTQEPPGDGEAESRRSGSIGQLAGSSYLALLLGVVTGPLIARAVGPAGRGEIAAAVVYSAIAATVVSLGVPLAIGHSLANRLATRGALLIASRRFSALTILPSLALGAVVVAGPLAGQSREGRAGAALLMAGVPLLVLASCLALFFVAEGSLKGLARVQLLPPALLAGATVAAFLLDRLTVLTYLCLVFVSTVVTVVVSQRALGIRSEKPASRRAPGIRGEKPASLGPLVRFGLRGYPGYLAIYAAVRIDQAIIGPLLGSAQLGLYAVAASIAIIPVALARAIASRAFGTLASAGDQDRAEVISTYLRIALAGGSLTCLAIAAASPLIPVLYGGAFGGSVLPLLWLLPGTVALCGSVVGLNCLTALGKPGRATLAELVGLAITLAGLPLVLGRFGITGAALLSTVSYSATFAVYLVFLSGYGRIRLALRREDLRWLWAAVRREAGRRR